MDSERAMEIYYRFQPMNLYEFVINWCTEYTNELMDRDHDPTV